MAKEPKDREDAGRSPPPADEAQAPRTPDLGSRARSDSGFLDDESFLLDVGDEAPRARASEEESPEEWILVDDDGSPTRPGIGGDADAGPARRAPAGVNESDEEAARLLAEMQQIASELSPTKAFEAEEAARTAEAAAPEVAAPAPAGEVGAPVGGEVAEPLAPSIAPAPRLAAAPAAPAAAPARPMRKQMSRAAAMLVAAALVVAAWIFVQHYGKENLPTPVATRPITDPAAKPKPPPPDPHAPKMNGKPVPPPKPELENAKPPDPAPVKPVVPAPAPAHVDPAPANDLNANATKDPAATKPSPSPVATEKPVEVVDNRQPIRPGKVGPGVELGKSGAPAKKTDTIVELRNGYTYRGRIKRVKDDKITLGVPGGEYTFALADVKVLDSSAPEYRTEADMPPASVILKSGQRLRGKLMKKTADRVVLVVENGEMVIENADIREVSFTGRIHF